MTREFRRVNSEYRGARLKSQQKESNGWTGQDLGRLYTECCRTREEFELAAIRNILQEHPTTPPRTIDLSNIPLSRSAVETLSDLLSVNFGLKKLILENCGLDDQVCVLDVPSFVTISHALTSLHRV